MAKQPRSLQGKIAVVTGGGRGIGKATAQALAREGIRVAIGDVDGASAEQAAAELGEGAYGAALDVTDRTAFTAFLDDVEQRLGPIDVLVNNAGIMPLSPLDEEDDATTFRQLELNLHAVIHGTREAMRRMKPRRTGHIVNVASTAGKAGFPGGATYCATKFGVVGMSEAVRGELRDFGVEVSVVMPGIVDTELAAGLKESRGVKIAKPQDVAEAIVEALRLPRFDVFVPKSIGPILAVVAPLPRGARERVAKALKSDSVLLNAANAPERAAYEKRAAESTPAANEVQAEASQSEISEPISAP
jgi:NAD(P)-dependent dehydrogenase (short-subunit alcohol dehydrogenase family)